MSNQDQAPIRFKPERPIYLSKENTGYKTEIEVIHAVELLRSRHYLAVYSANDEIRPFHMSFNSEPEFQLFKKVCNELKIPLKSPIIKPETIESLDHKEKHETIIREKQSNSTIETPEGHIIVE